MIANINIAVYIYIWVFPPSYRRGSTADALDSTTTITLDR